MRQFVLGVVGFALLTGGRPSAALAKGPMRHWSPEVSAQAVTTARAWLDAVVAKDAARLGELAGFPFHWARPDGKERGCRTVRARAAKDFAGVLGCMADPAPSLKLLLPKLDLEIQPTDEGELIVRATAPAQQTALGRGFRVRIILDSATGRHVRAFIIEDGTKR